MTIKYAYTLLAGVVLACSRHDAKTTGAQVSKGDSLGRSASSAMPSKTADASAHYCSGDSGSFRVSEDSVGPLDLWLPLQNLRAICPAAQDTIHYGENDTYPSVVFHFHGVTAVATQWEDSLLPNKPADVWAVFGDKGLLYGRLPLAAHWAAFRDALGPRGLAHGGGFSVDEEKVTVMFCAYPRIFFDVEAPPNSVEEDSQDLSRIPSDATIRNVAFFQQPNPTWHC